MYTYNCIPVVSRTFVLLHDCFCPHHLASTLIQRYATHSGHCQLEEHSLPCQFGQSVRQLFNVSWQYGHSRKLEGEEKVNKKVFTVNRLSMIVWVNVVQNTFRNVVHID